MVLSSIGLNTKNWMTGRKCYSSSTEKTYEKLSDTMRFVSQKT